MQDPNRSDTAARRASKEIAMTVWQHAAKIDDRPTTELGLRPHRQQLFLSKEKGRKIPERFACLEASFLFCILHRRERFAVAGRLRACIKICYNIKRKRGWAFSILALFAYPELV